MEELAAVPLGFIITGAVLFIVTIVLAVLLHRKTKYGSLKSVKFLRVFIVALLTLPVGLFIFQSIANVQGYDTNDMLLFLIEFSPLIFLVFVVALVGIHLYLKSSRE